MSKPKFGLIPAVLPGIEIITAEASCQLWHGDIVVIQEDRKCRPMAWSEAGQPDIETYLCLENCQKGLMAKLGYKKRGLQA